MKIFISIPWFSPAYKAGGPIQSIANMVQAMGEAYTFYIFCSNEDADHQSLAVTAVNSWTHHNSHTHVYYATQPQRSQKLSNAIEKIQPDVLFMVGLFSPTFTLVPLFFGKAPLKILSVRGMLHPGALSIKSVKKNLYIAALKALGISRRCVFHGTDAAEQKFIKEVFGAKARVAIAGNFPKQLAPQSPLHKIENQLVLLSICLLSTMKNIGLVLAALGQCTANISYFIYGPVKDAAYWDRCLAQINKLPKNITVYYFKECLPADVPAVLQKAHVFILPSKSENYGHAIIEALTVGLPVITSKHTPWDGLEASGAGFNVEADVDAITTAIQHYALMDHTGYAAAAQHAAAYAKQRIDLHKILEENEALFNSAVL